MPELIPEGQINFMLWVMLATAALTFIIATGNFVTSAKRLREAVGALDERTIIIAKGVLRAGIGGIVVAIAGLIFTGQALLGEFNLVNNWFSYAFLGAIYAGTLNCFVQGIADRKDRIALDRLGHTTKKGK